jgi:hypothetical protein
MKVDAECYAGRKADERPVRFRLEGKQYSVKVVLEGYELDSILYKVRADNQVLICGGKFQLVRT